MKIVIEIPEEVHNIVTEEGTIYGGGFAWLMNSVANGVVLPEDHGRLIDADALKTQIPSPIEDEYKTVHGILDDAPTIIEASEEGAVG